MLGEFSSLEIIKRINNFYLKFRKKNKFTNVLAFPSQLEDNNEINNLLGDIALCVEVSQKEAEKQELNVSIVTSLELGLDLDTEADLNICEKYDPGFTIRLSESFIGHGDC